MVKHAQTVRWLLSKNCLSVFDHFVGLTLKGLNESSAITINVAHFFILAWTISFILGLVCYLLVCVYAFHKISANTQRYQNVVVWSHYSDVMLQCQN